MNAVSGQVPCEWTLVAAVANGGVIGKGGALPWKLSRDLRRFKTMTMGHCLLMGRKTFESIGRPLPGRQTIVLSRSGFPGAPQGVTVVSDLSEVQRHVQPERRVMVVGGSQIYRATLGWCREIWLTRVLADVDGDVLFPDIDWDRWKMESSESFEAGPRDDWPTEFQVWKRKANH